LLAKNANEGWQSKTKQLNLKPMKTEKMSFKNIKDVLSRDEMMKIMAGSGGGLCGRCDTGRGMDFCYNNNGWCLCYVASGPGRPC
jgi:hypothetical protein